MTTPLYKDPEAGKLYWLREIKHPYSQPVLTLVDVNTNSFSLDRKTTPILCCGIRDDGGYHIPVFITPNGNKFEWDGLTVAMPRKNYVDYLEEVENDDE